MGWPQYTFIGLMALNLGLILGLHGKPRTGNHSFGSAVIGVGITTGVVWAGGFFG